MTPIDEGDSAGAFKSVGFKVNDLANVIRKSIYADDLTGLLFTDFVNKLNQHKLRLALFVPPIFWWMKVQHMGHLGFQCIQVPDEICILLAKTYL